MNLSPNLLSFSFLLLQLPQTLAFLKFEVLGTIISITDSTISPKPFVFFILYSFSYDLRSRTSISSCYIVRCHIKIDVLQDEIYFTLHKSTFLSITFATVCTNDIYSILFISLYLPLYRILLYSLTF